MTDVTHLAGVSHQTVSRVLDDHPNVREQTRRRVRAAIVAGCRASAESAGRSYRVLLGGRS